jgi:hypothetical protein
MGPNMAWRDGITTLLEFNNFSPSLQYWNKILNYFDRHKNTLSVSDLEALAYESERCRLYWNKERTETKCFHKNGKIHEMVIKKPGLGIEKNDVNPNIEKFIAQKTEPNIQEEYEDETPPEENNPNFVAQMAALPYNK